MATYVADVTISTVVYDRNHYFGFGPILIPKPKLIDSFGRYRNHISKGKSTLRKI